MFEHNPPLADYSDSDMSNVRYILKKIEISVKNNFQYHLH